MFASETRQPGRVTLDNRGGLNRRRTGTSVITKYETEVGAGMPSGRCATLASVASVRRSPQNGTWIVATAAAYQRTEPVSTRTDTTPGVGKCVYSVETQLQRIALFF